MRNKRRARLTPCFMPFTRQPARRKRHGATTIILALLVFIAPQIATANPDIQHWRTPAGTPVYYVHASQIPMADIRLQFDAGHARSGSRQGIASMTATLLKQGAGDMTMEQIIDKLDDLGARYGAGADYDKAQVSLRSLSDDNLFNQALELFITIISKPNFPLKNFRRQKKLGLAHIKARDQNIGSVRSRAFTQAIYKKHVYGSFGAGTYETVNSITRDDVIRFYREFYVRNNLNIVIVWDVEREKAEEIARRISEALEHGTKPPPIPPVPPLSTATLLRVDFPSQQTHVVIGQPLIKVGDPDFYALYLGNHILGGSGFGSRLLEEIRVKRGLAYSSGSRFGTRREAGPFSISFQTRADQAELARGVAMDVLTNFLENGPTAEELQLARDSILGGLPLRFASNSSILGAVSRITYYGLPPDHLAQFKPRIEAVTREDIIAAFRRHIHPDKMVTVVVGGGE